MELTLRGRHNRQVAGSVESQTGLWECLRRNPTDLSEIGVLFAVPQLAPHVDEWWSKESRTPSSDDPGRAARRLLRRSAGVARRGGLITGSAFYVGMAPAIAMIYCEQLVLVLRIAAVYGREPMDPVRAAEILVIQGRYKTPEEAAGALARLRMPVAPEADRAHTALRVVQQLPSMIGLRLRKVNWRSPLDVIVTGAEIASYLVPVISLPVWAYTSARAMRELGRSAIDFYSGPSLERPTTPVELPPRPSSRTRRLVFASVIPLAVALGVLFYIFPFGLNHSALRWIGFILGDAALLVTFARLIWLTSQRRSKREAQ